MKHILWGLSLALVMMPVTSNAEIYKWTDKNGVVRYSDIPPPSNIPHESLSKKGTKTPVPVEAPPPAAGPEGAPAPQQQTPEAVTGDTDMQRQEEAAAAYQQVIKSAFRDVADALVGYQRAREFRDTQQQLVTSAQDARRLADLRYQGGATSYLEVLDSDTRLFSAELDLAEAQRDELNAFVEIYRALGGGWIQ